MMQYKSIRFTQKHVVKSLPCRSTNSNVNFGRREEHRPPRLRAQRAASTPCNKTSGLRPLSGWTASSFPELRMPGWEVRSSVDGKLLRVLSQRTTRPELPFKAFNSEPFIRQHWIEEIAKVETPLGTAVKTPERNINCSSKKRKGQCKEQSPGVIGQKSKRPAFFMWAWGQGLGPKLGAKALVAAETSVQRLPPPSLPGATTQTSWASVSSSVR